MESTASAKRQALIYMLEHGELRRRTVNIPKCDGGVFTHTFYKYVGR